MNKNFAKMIDRQIQFAENFIEDKEKGILITCPFDSTYKEYGYLPVEYVQRPAGTDDYTYVSSFTAMKTKIKQVWIKQEYDAAYKMDLLKSKLADMDYKTSKYVDGEYTAEEWAEIVAERTAIRKQIRELEAEIQENDA